MNPLRRLRFLFRKDQLDREMDEEMQFHVEMQARENAEAGVPKNEAEYLARRQFGRVDRVKEKVRERRGLLWLESLVRDVHFSARSLRRSPGFTAAVVITLAVAIGLVTAIVNVSRQVLAPALPYPESDRLVILREGMPQSPGYYMLPFRFTAYSEHASSFTALGAETTEMLNLVVNDSPFAVQVSCVTPGYFAALGVSCRDGRTFLPAEHLPKATGTAVVISDQAWRRYFNSDPSIVGKDIRIDDQLRRVVGVLNERFNSLLPPGSGSNRDGIYLPAKPEAVPERLSEVSYATAVGRLKPGISLEQAQAALHTIKPAMPPGSGPPFTELEPFLLPLADAYRERHAQPFRLFLGAASFLFLIGCTAVANLVVARTIGRRRELGVRLALGGGRRRIMTLIFTEAGILTLVGAAGGALIAWWAERVMAILLPDGFGNGALLRRFDMGTITVATLLGVITCVLAGSLPAWRAGRTNLNDSLKEGPGALGESRKLRFVRGTLVALQSALAVALLIGAGLMIESVYRLQHIDLGFDPSGKVALVGNRRNLAQRKTSTLQQLDLEIVNRIARLPGVTHAAQTSTVPAAGLMVLWDFTVEGREDPQSFQCYSYTVSPDFFAAMGMHMIAGNGFSDLRPGDRQVAVIDESTAHELFPDESPIGKRVITNSRRLEIVGVVPKTATGYRGDSVFDLHGNPIKPRQLYVPIWQASRSRLLNVILQVSREAPANLVSTVRQAVYEIDPSVVVTLRPFAQVIDEATRAERHTRTMLQALSGLALLLAAFGMFSVMAYTVTQRQGELGLRMVLGATPSRLLRLVLQRGLRLALIGIVLGVIVALALTRLMGSLLYETSPQEPKVYVGVTVLLFVTAVVACLLPARRAAKIDPAITLRAE